MKDLIEGIDYYINEDGYVVLTEKYHLDRGYCCGNGCKHCPYGYKPPNPLKGASEESKNGNSTSEKK